MCMGVAKIRSNEANRYKAQQQRRQQLAWQPVSFLSKQVEKYVWLDFDQIHSLMAPADLQKIQAKVVSG